MKWHEKVLKYNRREITSGTIFAITSALALLIWHHTFGATFTWESISPISTPWEYAFYSALVFIGPGYYLRFKTKFYLNLWKTFKHDRQTHKDVKKVIWLTMCLLVLGVVIAVVWLLNHIISFCYNIIRLLLFLSPPLGIGLIAFFVSYLLMKKDSIT